MELIEKAVKIIAEADNIVCLLGAGASVPSGIPDFRSAAGLYAQNANAEEILSHSYFKMHPDKFYKFYKEKMLYPQAKPNPIHYTLAKWEKQGKLKACLTQNIDGLELVAGIKNVLQLHGTVLKNHCTKCGEFYDLNYILEHGDPVPLCSKCQGIIKPDVVLYEEPLDTELLQRAVYFVKTAQVILVIGTSLRVYPVAGLLHYYVPEKQKLIIINMQPTPFDDTADVVINAPAEKVLVEVDEKLQNK